VCLDGWTAIEPEGRSTYLYLKTTRKRFLTEFSSVHFFEYNLLCRNKQVIVLCNFKRTKSLYFDIVFVKCTGNSTVKTARRYVKTDVNDNENF
jgi:hypothetical protein